VAATYADTLPTALDRIRYALGDTTVSAPLLQDETITAAVTEWGETEATARLAEGLATRYAQKPSSVGLPGLSVSWGERVKAWWELARRTREGSATAAASGSNGGSVTTLRASEEERTEYRRPEWVPWPSL
jgi:hypothetical protein